jgi:hypothetical protein
MLSLQNGSAGNKIFKMRLIKLGLLSVFFLFFIATAVSLLIPSHIRISKAINIYGRQDAIFAMVRDTQRWKEWHPAFMRGDSAPAFPSIRISMKTETDSELVMQLQQGAKKPVINGWKIYQHSPLDSLTLQWYMDFRLKWYPWQKFGSLFYENTYGILMEEGLTNIKKNVEQPLPLEKMP